MPIRSNISRHFARKAVIKPTRYGRNVLRKRKTVDKKLSFVYVTVRLSLYILAFALCSWQVSLYVGRYLSEPIYSYVDVEETFPNYTIPKIVVCPFGLTVTAHLKQKMMSLCRAHNESCNITEFELQDVNLSLIELWNENDIKYCQGFLKCDEAISEDCVSRYFNGVAIDTIQGRCYSFKNDIVYHFISTESNQFKLICNVTKMQTPLHLTAQIYFSSNAIFKYSLDNDKLPDASSSHFHLAMTEFQNINSDRDPCWTEDEVNDCMNLCMDNFLKEHTHCRLPFYQLVSLPYCSSYADLLSFEKEIIKVYTTLHKCKCKRACHSILYRSLVDADTSEEGEIKRISFSAAIPKMFVTEMYSYHTQSLIADLMSNVGFYLSISFISAFDFIMRGVQKINPVIKTMSDTRWKSPKHY